MSKIIVPTSLIALIMSHSAPTYQVQVVIVSTAQPIMHYNGHADSIPVCQLKMTLAAESSIHLWNLAIWRVQV